MHTENTISVQADLDDVFRLAAEIRRWPELLPHYRWVKPAPGSTDGAVEMAARRGWIPVKWTSVQTVFREESRIRYTHVGGLTRGMYVEWIFEPSDGGVDVTIIHELTLETPIVSSSLGKWIVGEIFVKYIADRTLQRIKDLAEGHADAL